MTVTLEPCKEHEMWPCPVCQPDAWIRGNAPSATVIREYEQKMCQREKLFNWVALGVSAGLLILAIWWLG
jgi:hypothetical protein